MKNQKIITLMAICLISAFLFIFAGVQNQKLLNEIEILKSEKPLPNKPHTCPFVTCPYKGETKFNNQLCGCEIGGDCSALDSIHYFNPDWSYDECENYLWTGKPTKETDYQINVHLDTLWLYDGKRLVGRIDYTKEKLDSLIWIDNE